jgi:hypothetical protein
MHNGAVNTGSCAIGNSMNEQECKDFAAAQGHSSYNTGSWDSDYPNCQGDQQSGNTRFNTDTDTKGTWGPTVYGRSALHHFHMQAHHQPLGRFRLKHVHSVCRGSLRTASCGV